MTNEHCDHTLYATDDRGRLLGSWMKKKKGRQVRIVCAVCGRFFGYRETRKRGHARRTSSRDDETQS